MWLRFQQTQCPFLGYLNLRVAGLLNEEGTLVAVDPGLSVTNQGHGSMPVFELIFGPLGYPPIQ